jgi:hypothetical protein
MLVSAASVFAADPPEPPNGGDFSHNMNPEKVPEGVLIVKGAWSSASDATTPLPEGGKVAGHVYHNPYFGLTFPLAQGWTQSYDGPPPSDSGYYVLAQLQLTAAPEGQSRGSVLIGAQDMFFTPTAARSALELVSYARDHLGASYTVEKPPAEVRIAGHSFARLAYESPVTGLHWYMLATQARCHTVQFVFTSSDPRLIAGLVRSMSATVLEEGEAPVCVQDYASSDNVIKKVQPFFSERRANPVPVRLVIDTRGRVEHIHVLSAFPDQAKVITDALMQWQFKPYSVNGRAVKVETGMLFGRTAGS